MVGFCWPAASPAVAQPGAVSQGPAEASRMWEGLKERLQPIYHGCALANLWSNGGK